MPNATRAAMSLALLLPLSDIVNAITERETFEVSVSIPTAEFYVIPSEPDWIHQEQALPFNPVSGSFAPLRKNFDVKNVNGGITARISAEPFLSNGRDTDNIPLIVTFNRKRLSLVSEPVITGLDGQAGQRVGLEIAAALPVDGYQPGSYYGSVHMIFEALAP
ncbi:CS1 type fimbrial major subunit [Pseudomonas sp. NPDC098747]|uniref:CS1 type fimbrial major subunit n=1 Tax=Pseudomonas sp. NPDC098747 TaxID=3364487 RepID=UPI00383AADF6